MRQDAKSRPQPLDFIGPNSLCSQRDQREQWAMNVNYKLDVCFCWPLLLSNVSQVNLDSCHEAFLWVRVCRVFHDLWPFCQRSSRFFAVPFPRQQRLLGVTLTVQTDGRCWTKWNYSDRFYLSRRTPEQKWFRSASCRSDGYWMFADYGAAADAA